MVQLNFDASTVAPSAAPEPLETGWYPANILMTEQKPTQAGDGGYLEITHRITSGRTFKCRLNLWNKSQQAVDIAYAELSSICHATGRLRVGVAAELHGAPLEIYLKKVPRNDKPNEMTNEVKGYRAIGAAGSTPGFTGAVGSQATSAPAWASPAQPAPPAAAAPAQPTWAPPPAAAVAPPQPAYAPPPQPAPVAVAPAAAGSVPPWAR